MTTWSIVTMTAPSDPRLPVSSPRCDSAPQLLTRWRLFFRPYTWLGGVVYFEQ